MSIHNFKSFKEDHSIHNEPSEYEKKIDNVVNQVLTDNPPIPDKTDIKDNELRGNDINVSDLDDLSDVNEARGYTDDEIKKSIRESLRKLGFIGLSETDLSKVINPIKKLIIEKKMGILLDGINEDNLKSSNIGEEIIRVNKDINTLSDMGEIEDEEVCPSCGSDIKFNEERALNKCIECDWTGIDERNSINENQENTELNTIQKINKEAKDNDIDLKDEEELVKFIHDNFKKITGEEFNSMVDFMTNDRISDIVADNKFGEEIAILYRDKYAKGEDLKQYDIKESKKIIIDVKSPEMKLLKECLGDKLPEDKILSDFIKSNLPNYNFDDIKDVWGLIK